MTTCKGGFAKEEPTKDDQRGSRKTRGMKCHKNQERGSLEKEESYTAGKSMWVMTELQTLNFRLTWSTDNAEAKERTESLPEQWNLYLHAQALDMRGWK